MGVLSVVLLLAVLISLLTLAAWNRATVLTAIRRFFTEPGSAINLAVARIVFFAVVLWELFATGLNDVQDYSRLPAGLISPPHVLGGVLAALPINPVCVTAAWIALLTAGVFGLVGVLPRLSALVVAFAGFYYLGVPQLYGYVKHDQHILWIAAIFAVSPSADALSIQTLWRRWRRRPLGRGDGQPPRALQYALPLRFIWLLMGVLYLSAGLAKYRFDGLRWLEPSTLRYWMHELWFEDGNYRPPVIHRPDELSPLLSIGAAYTLLFELTFLPWLFSRRARPFLALAGLAFHNLTNVLLNIPFWSLQAFYLTLFDWDRILRRAAPRLRLAQHAPSRPTNAAIPVIALGTALLLCLLAVILPGVRSANASRASVEGWPLASYPSFAEAPSVTADELSAFTVSELARSGDLTSGAACRSSLLTGGMASATRSSMNKTPDVRRPSSEIWSARPVSRQVSAR